MTRALVIDPRFCGPPDSGNGGYVCGLLAAAAGGAVAVRLKRPPPLGVPLDLTEADGVVTAGEPCVVIGWLRASEGRKHGVGTAIFGPGGERVAQASATWIAPRA
jgi:hypothetical protein